MAEAKISLGCELMQRADLDVDYDILLGEVTSFHIADEVLGEDGLVDPKKLAPVARLGGSQYAELGELFELGRPQVPLQRSS